MKGRTTWCSILDMDEAFYWATLQARRVLANSAPRSVITRYAVAWDSTATPRRAR